MEGENKDLYKYGSNKIKELDKDLWNKINSISIEASFKEKFYLLENSIFDLPKCECGKSVKFIDMIKGYRKFCSKRCMYDSVQIKENKKKTSIINWGVDNPSKSKKVKDKVKKTNIDKFGYEWATKSKEVKEKIKDKFIENWGVDNPSKVKEVRDKAKETMMERWGVDNPMHSDDIRDKVKSKFIENWGVDNPSKVKEVRDKAKETMMERWGVEHALQNDELLSKSKNTMLERWGVDSPLKNKEVLDKMKINNLEKWGFENPSKNEKIKEKIKKSILEKYNTLNLLELDEIKEKVKNTNIEKWGKDHISKSSIYREKYKISNHPNYIEYLKDGIYIKEKDLFNFIKSIYNNEVIQSHRDGMEIDIYLPEIGIGFEFNGLYWHSEKWKDKSYHINKTNYFKERGIRIIHIWEDDWTFNRDIIKSQIKNWLNRIEEKLFARKCDIKLVTDIKLIKKFLNENHIQGYVNSNLFIGLYSNNELVTLMSFDHLEGRKRMSDSEWNLSRFCNKIETNVVGGASKLLNHFIKKFNPSKIISYADNSWSNGDLYSKLGFEKISESNPDYKYIIESKRVHKSRFKKSNLKISNITESDYTKMNNILKIWDCGKLKYQMILNNNF